MMPRPHPFVASSLRRSVALLILCASVSLWPTSASAQTPPDRTFALRYALEKDPTWSQVQRLPQTRTSIRAIFAAALTCAEAKEHTDRIEKLLDVAADMQDRDPASKTYGNFRWYTNHTKVDDFNSVDFCTQTAVLLWIRHHQTLTPAARDKLHSILELAAHGLLNHKVAPSYTNIALMNAGDLILLGEALNKPDIAAEGTKRLDTVYKEIATNGVHEYVSPTYLAVDIADVGLLEAHTTNPRVRALAKALLTFFWTDVAANFYPPNLKIAGTHSRTYDYLHGTGEADLPLWFAGWLPLKEPPGMRGLIHHTLIQYTPPPELYQIANTFPRLVRQTWGPDPYQSRTHYLHRDITLSTSASPYGGRMDMPLTVDLPGDRNDVRCYFIPDGRQDPYGKKPIAAGAHTKAFHLQPFFTATQEKDDALALAVYRSKDFPPETTIVQSHFVMPRNVDSFWIGSTRVDLAARQFSFPVQLNQPVFLRKGTAAVAIRVLLSRSTADQAAPITLENDGNPHNAIRLTITHGQPAPHAAVALQIRIGSDLSTDSAFTTWCNAFTQSLPTVHTTGKSIDLSTPSLSISAQSPYKTPLKLTPAPSRTILEINGQPHLLPPIN